jgi:mRNA interferase MazF
MVRGEIFRFRPPRGRRGSEQRGARYGVVVQNDALLGMSTVLVAPTSTSAMSLPFRPAIEVDGVITRVIVEHTTALAPGRLGQSVGRLGGEELRKVDLALSFVMGLSRPL